jgi:hypothetical protein
MKKMAFILLLLLVSLSFSSSGFAYMVGDVNADNRVDLTEAINALQVTSGVRTPASASATINVPADVPTIQQAIDAAKSGDIINLAAGTYTGALTIANKALTIQGANKATTIITSGNVSTTALTVDGAKLVTLSGVTLQNSSIGILAMRGAAVEVTNAIVQDTNSHGIQIVDNSTAKLTDVTVQRSIGGHGIRVMRSSSITFSGTVTCGNHSSNGIDIAQSSSLYLSNAAVTVNNNGNRGISIFNSAGLFAEGSSLTVNNNGNRGIVISNSSGLLTENSSITAQNNASKDGIYVHSGSSFHMQMNSTLLSEGNLIGVRAMSSSSFWTDDTSPVTIRACGTGLSISEVSTAAFNGSLTVVNTTGTGSGISLDRNSSLRIMGSLLITNDAMGNGVGVSMTRGAVTSFFAASPSQQPIVIQNNKTGIMASESSISGASLTIKNNINDIQAFFGAKVSLPAGSYETCTADGSTLGITCP